MRQEREGGGGGGSEGKREKLRIKKRRMKSWNL